MTAAKKQELSREMREKNLADNRKLEGRYRNEDHFMIEMVFRKIEATEQARALESCVYISAIAEERDAEGYRGAVEEGT